MFPDRIYPGLGSYLAQQTHRVARECGYRRVIHALDAREKRIAQNQRALRQSLPWLRSVREAAVNVAHLLSERARSCGDRPAIIEGFGGRNGTLTFAELELAASRSATRLRESGLRPGDSALVLVPMSAELYIALIAIFRLGLVAMFLDPGREICPAMAAHGKPACPSYAVVPVR